MKLSTHALRQVLDVRDGGAARTTKKEAKLVVERLSKLTDQTKAQVEYFDDKISVGLTLLVAALGKSFQEQNPLKWEEFAHLVMIYTAAEYDALVISWKEKVRFDAIRPTTVLQNPRRYGTPYKLKTWAGPGMGVSKISARDFQPFKRVMPHSEYPSGSGCICTAVVDAVRSYTQEVFGNSDMVLSVETAAGSSKVEPGMTPATTITSSFQSLEEFRNRCGESRLEGGMHFTKSVPDSYELCKDMGDPALEYGKALLNGDTLRFM